MKRLLTAAALMLLTTTAHADGICAVIRPTSDGWLAVRIGPGTQHHITRKLLPGREVHIEHRSAGNWQFITTWVTKNDTTEEVTGWVYGPLLKEIVCEDGCN